MTQHNRMQNNVIYYFIFFNIRSRIGKEQSSKILKMLFANEKSKLSGKVLQKYDPVMRSLR